MEHHGLQKRNYIHVSPTLVNSKYSLTKQESNIVLLLLTIIDKDDEDFKNYTFTKKDLEKRTGIKLDSLKLKQLAKSLMSKVLEVPTDEDNFELFTWFSYFKYDNGVITCGFDKRLKKYLLELHQYILINAPDILLMKSDYSRRIYMLLKERANFGERKFEVEELMNILDVPKSLKIYADFKRKVLLQAVKEINKFTDLEIKNIGTSDKPIYFKEIKFPRKVKTIIFYTKKNKTDLNEFIKIIREMYTNQNLYANKNNRMLKCSEKGLLYYANTETTLDKDSSLKAWEWLHEHKESLICFNPIDGIEEIIIKTEEELHYLDSKETFINYIKENFRDTELLSARNGKTNEPMKIKLTKENILIDNITDTRFPTNTANLIWEHLYNLAQNNKLKIL